MEKFQPKIESRFEIAQRDKQRLFEKLGVSESQEDQEKINTSLNVIRFEIEKSPVVGRSLEQTPTSRREFVIPVISSEQRDQLLENLYELGIFPWEEDGVLIIDHKKDLEKLTLAGIVNDSSYQEPIAAPETFTSVDVESKMYEFRLPNPGPVKKTQTSTRPPKPNDLTESLEDPGIDTELKEIIAKFDAGIVEEEDPEFTNAVGSMPTLTLFPHKYIWKNKQLTHARTGEAISHEEEFAVLQKAQEGDARSMNEFIRMHTGLVIYIAKRVQDRLGGDIDEIFQGGLVGLEYAIRNFDPEHEDANFTAYAAVCIEGIARKELQKTRPGISIPSHVSGKRRQVFSMMRNEEKKDQLGLTKNDTEDIFRKNKIDGMARNLLMTAKYDPIEDHFDDDAWNKIDYFGNDLALHQEQESVTDYINLQEILKDAMNAFDPRQKIIIAARYGFAEPFMLPEETESIVKRRGIEFTPEGNVANPEDLEPIDWFVLYISNRLLARPPVDFEEGFTLDEVGALYAVSKERIRQIEAKCLRMMRHPSRSRKTIGYVGQEFTASSLPEPDTHERSASEIEGVIQKLRNQQNPDRLYPPHGWKTVHSSAQEIGISAHSLKEKLSIFRKSNPEWLHEYVNIRTGRQTEFIHPDLIELLGKEQEDSSTE